MCTCIYQINYCKLLLRFVRIEIFQIRRVANSRHCRYTMYFVKLHIATIRDVPGRAAAITESLRIFRDRRVNLARERPSQTCLVKFDVPRNKCHVQPPLSRYQRTIVLLEWRSLVGTVLESFRIEKFDRMRTRHPGMYASLFYN